MITERAASRTALSVAEMRAVHQLLDGEPKVLDDRVSARLLGRPPVARDDEAARALRARVVLRSRIAEARLAEAVTRGVRQCVILGAGFDAFAYRQPDWAKDLHIFEVDHHATQEEKRRRLAAARVALPENLSFVAIDFETISLKDGLAASSLDFAQPAFFSCLGVLVYLTAEAVDTVFTLVASFPRGSEIVCTIASPKSLASRNAISAHAAGEPWLTAFSSDEIRTKLFAMGFSQVRVADPEEVRRAFGTRRDGLAAPQAGNIVSAIV